jgi:hypothetical protein
MRDEMKITEFGGFRVGRAIVGQRDVATIEYPGNADKGYEWMGGDLYEGKFPLANAAGDCAS